MNTSRTLWALGLIIVVGGLAFVAAGYTTPQEAHVLQGTLSQDGRSYTYAEDKPYYSVSVEYPAHTALSGGADIKAREFMETALQAQVVQFKQDSGVETLTAQDAQYQNITADHKYALGIEYKEYGSPNYDSFLFSIYEDTLGAHPNGFFKTFVFDQNGKIISIEDIVKGKGLSALAALVRADVVKQMQTRLGQQDVSGALFEDGLAPTDNNYSNFIVDNTDLLIELPPYQVAAYAMGTFEVRVPLSNFQ
ncbi:MAG: DUF3298 domain-containing protein [Patescibacteria group bacterium]|nr:DUF3298 domain-containing protein [Patescibacteria group bacterium]